MQVLTGISDTCLPSFSLSDMCTYSVVAFIRFSFSKKGLICTGLSTALTFKRVTNNVWEKKSGIWSPFSRADCQKMQLIPKGLICRGFSNKSWSDGGVHLLWQPKPVQWMFVSFGFGPRAVQNLPCEISFKLQLTGWCINRHNSQNVIILS